MNTNDDALGSAAQEAFRLLEAVRGWLDERGVPEASIAAGSAECRACPVCVVLGALRDHHPDVVDQLGRASDALIAAARALLSEQEHKWANGSERGVERIDID